MKRLGQWIAFGAIVGVASGTASAAFLWLLDHATSVRLAHPWLIFALPVAGVLIGLALDTYGRSVKGGNNLVIDTIHDGGPQIPLRMTPVVLFGTVLTHLFGGSAGREGTAVQMGASLSDWINHRFALDASLRSDLLSAGVAAGFGSVFGTPWAGAIFGLELVTVRRLRWRALVPSMVASFVGDLVTRAWGIEHTQYPTAPGLTLGWVSIFKWLVVAVAIAVVAVVFIEATHRLKKLGTRSWLRMAIGGSCVVVLWKVLGTDDYLGLGVPTIVRAFTDPTIAPWAFAAKSAFTIITLGSGFLGGEVTPLFFIGATLGNTLGVAMDLPLALAAGVGMAAMFGAAAKTPLALSVMAVELVGLAILPHVLFVAVIASLLTGRRSIYSSQRHSLPQEGLESREGLGP